MGYVAKSVVDASHVEHVNAAIEPSQSEIERAAALIALFEEAQRRGEGRAVFEGTLVEKPAYTTAQRLLLRGEAKQRYQLR